MRVFARALWLPKSGNTTDEYEDAFYPARDGEYGGTEARFAVADGASEGMLSGQWAQILVRSYCRMVGPGDLSALLKRAQQSWQEWRQHYLDERARQDRPVQWFEEPGLEKGAFSTLLGLTLSEGDGAGRWEALALGDSCLFQIRAGDLMAAVPIDDAQAFGSRPYLIASHPARNNGLLDFVHYAGGTWESGDQFYLMTDALAHWFMTACEADAVPWRTLQAAATSAAPAFQTWIASLKMDHLIRNDDVTLLCLEVV